MFCPPHSDVFQRSLLKSTKLAGFANPNAQFVHRDTLDSELMAAGDNNPRCVTAIANSRERKRERERERELIIAGAAISGSSVPLKNLKSAET